MSAFEGLMKAKEVQVLSVVLVLLLAFFLKLPCFLSVLLFILHHDTDW